LGNTLYMPFNLNVLQNLQSNFTNKYRQLVLFIAAYIYLLQISYFCKKSYMESTKKSTGLYWILFLLSVAGFFFVYKIGGGYCSMVLPFNVTFFAKAMDLL
jgi:hypothetical protein